MTSINLSIDLEEMQRFLQEAKRATFTGNGPRSEIEGIRLYQFSRGAWDYEDRYVGNLLDTGLEVVRFDKFPIWAMTYRGGMLPEAHQRASETFSFLKEALNLVPLEIPIRGPKTYSRGDWRYENFLMGELIDFHGQEHILMKGTKIYTRVYQGGCIYDKRYSMSLLSSKNELTF